MASNWSAEQELGIVVAICSSGFQLSGLVMMGISGELCSTIGWEYIFYFCAGVQLIWLLLFIWLFSSTPAESRFISQAELQYLSRNQAKKITRVPLTKVPWGKIVTSAPVLAVFFDTYCTWFFGSIVAFFLPTYLKEVLYVGAAKNGLYSALPSLTLLIGRNLSGYLSDRLTVRFGATKSVKILNTISGLIPAVMFSGLSLIDCRQSELAIICVTVSYFFFAFFTGGYLKSLISIVPAYAGVLTGLNFIFGYTATITLSYLIGSLTKHHTIDEWRQALFMGVGALAAGTFVFALFGSGQPIGDWAKDRIDQIDRKKAKHPTDHDSAVDDNSDAVAVMLDAG